MTTNTPSTSEAKAMIDDLAVAMSQYGQSTWVSISDGDRFQAPGNFADAVLALMRSYEESHATIARLESERDEAARLSHQHRNECERLTNALSAIRIVAALGSKHHKAPFDETPCAKRYDSIVERIDSILTPKEGARE